VGVLLKTGLDLDVVTWGRPCVARVELG